MQHEPGVKIDPNIKIRNNIHKFFWKIGNFLFPGMLKPYVAEPEWDTDPRHYRNNRLK